MSAEAVDPKQAATPVQAPTPAPVTSSEPTPRPSRQNLVVPRQHPLPIITGAIMSAVAGFGLVFAFGWGRGTPPPSPLDDMAATKQPDSAGDEPAPALLSPPDSVAPASAGRWQPRGSGADSEDEKSGGGDRYSARPVSHEQVTPAQYREDDRRLSRFSSSPDLPPLRPAVDVDEPPAVSSEPEVISPEPAVHAPLDVHADEPVAEPVAEAVTPPPPASLPEALAQPAADTVEAPVVAKAEDSDASSGDHSPAVAPTIAPPPEPLASEPTPELHEPATIEGDTGEAASSPPSTARAVEQSDQPSADEPSDAGEPTPSPPPSFAPSFAAVAAPQPEVTTPPPPSFVAPVPTPPAPLPQSEPPPSRLAAPQPPAAAIPVGMPTPSPFATAPPVGPPPTASPPSFDRPPRTASSSPSAGAFPQSTGPALAYDDEGAEERPSPLNPLPPIEGKAVPGPIQLEGVQTPQVAVEKRGPREIQVGRPARYEIIVRNVGTATAHDVALRDAVPRGTSLIATTPPAAPAERANDLIWALGAMPPGSEVRVLMELMPETEGEIGSIASVSFRADATMRSVATKPAIAIDCPAPKPVRIGGDVPVTLTLSNPGTGVATGVVLEGYLPDTVSHRSGGELEFDVGQLRPGESRTIDLVLGTRSPGRTPIRLVARADGGVETTLDVPLEVTAPTLEIAIDMPTRRFLQRPAKCTIAMVNSGTAAARSVELAAQLPSGMKFVKANNAGWHDERTHRVLWNLEELPAGETGSVEMVVMPVDPGEQRIVVAARSTDGPSDQAVHSCQVEGLAAVSFHVADSEDPVEVGGVTEYVVRVVNEGTKAATGVQLAATLVGDLEPVEASGPGGHRVENLTVIFERLAKLGAGEEAVYRVRARGLRAGHQRIQVRLISEDQPSPITKEETTSVYDDR